MPEASAIKEMFEGVAPRYDFLNRVLSLGIDRAWRRQVVESLELRPEHRVLDLCCGTGDLALEIAREVPVTACDFTWNMLTRARAKSVSSGRPLALACADTLELPFRNDLFDRATIAFGIRNLESMSAGLAEIRRVLKPGGRIAILEFSQPNRGWLKLPYRIYLDWLLPAVGGLLSRKEAYRYLAESIQGFPVPEVLVRLLEEAGFQSPRYSRLSGGIVALHIASK
ncbi:MAG TPA: bifunctional demethylmenaquinone methyltransferase/2-methoxy-6-polyprenyl-1,4-benzoquinol methylase UbiE [Vicinamibacteria bacterium]